MCLIPLALVLKNYKASLSGKRGKTPLLAGIFSPLPPLNTGHSYSGTGSKYTYGPFGEVLLKEGTFDSRFQFSTKEYDSLTGLNYYGYRLYDPKLGRWINRDPIGEHGGQNVYAFVNNNVTCSVDPLGLQADEKCCVCRAISLTLTKDDGPKDMTHVVDGSALYGYEIEITGEMQYEYRSTGWKEDCSITWHEELTSYWHQWGFPYSSPVSRPVDLNNNTHMAEQWINRNSDCPDQGTRSESFVLYDQVALKTITSRVERKEVTIDIELSSSPSIGGAPETLTINKTLYPKP